MTEAALAAGATVRPTRAGRSAMRRHVGWPAPRSSKTFLKRGVAYAEAYGTALEEAIHEPAGNDIMGAINLGSDVQRRAGPMGGRAVVTWSGKSLPCEEGWPLAGRPA
jgi:hypothetical protein